MIHRSIIKCRKISTTTVTWMVNLKSNHLPTNLYQASDLSAAARGPIQFQCKEVFRAPPVAVNSCAITNFGGIGETTFLEAIVICAIFVPL